MKGPPRMLNERKEGVSVFSILCGVLISLIVAAFLFELWMVNTFTSVRISGSSMRPTLSNGEWVYTRAVEAKRGDIITVDVSGYRDELGRPVFEEEIDVIIKRLIAVEGDTVWCDKEGVVYVQYAGETKPVALNEPYIASQTEAFDPVAVGEGQIFVMGDNRGNSTDSRKVGLLQKKDILGVVTEWSLQHKDFVTKWENFRGGFRSLFG